MTTAEITLDKRRLETWSAIHRAAASLVLEEGPAETTIDAIAEMAGISRRTFFNYFSTKEDAVLGLGPPEISADALAGFQDGEEDLLSGLVHFMISVVRTSYRLAPDPALRRQLIEQFPELRLRQLHYAGVVESMIAPILREKLSATTDTELVEEDTATKATAMLLFARAIVHFAFSRKSMSVPMTDAEIDAAISVFRKILKETP